MAEGPPLGTRVEIFWSGDLVWFAGSVTNRRVVEGVVLHCISYDDGEKHWHALEAEQWRREDSHRQHAADGDASSAPAEDEAAAAPPAPPPPPPAEPAAAAVSRRSPIAIGIAVLAGALLAVVLAVAVAGHDRAIPPAPPGAPGAPRSYRGSPLSSARAPGAPGAPLRPDDDDEILCDCGWTRVPGQSCKETRQKSGFPCWKDCCA